MEKTIFDQKPDVEVLFEFIGTRKNPAADGYRPHHLITDNYLTTGVHHYYEVATVLPDGDGSLISGRVVYRDWHGREIKMTWIDKIEFGCLFLVVLPIALLIRIYRIFRSEVTKEDRFVEFMTTKMDCELLK